MPTKNNQAKSGPRRKRLESSFFWILVLVAGTIAIIHRIWPCSAARECSGGSHEGLILGGLGLAAILFTLFYRLRKARPKNSHITLENYLYGHVVIGTLGLGLIVAHSGYRLQNEIAALALLFLFITVVSGIVGMFILYYVPRFQARHEAAVLLPDDLCLRISRLHDEIETLCREREGVFLEVYEQLVRPLYRSEVGKPPPCADVDPWSGRVDPADSEDFMHLAVKVEEVHDLLVLLGRHMRFRYWIRGWLLLHIPATIGLVVFTLMHVVATGWYYVP